MAKIVQLTYRQIIDESATGAFERMVFNQSFTEFTFKCQEYNPGGKYLSLAEMIAHNPKANSLHYKVALSIFDTMKQLKGIIPELANSLGIADIPFQGYEMRILESHPINQAEHKIAIDYTTAPMPLFEIVNGYLLLTVSAEKKGPDAPYKTFMVPMQPYLSISSYQEI